MWITYVDFYGAYYWNCCVKNLYFLLEVYLFPNVFFFLPNIKVVSLLCDLSSSFGIGVKGKATTSISVKFNLWLQEVSLLHLFCKPLHYPFSAMTYIYKGIPINLIFYIHVERDYLSENKSSSDLTFLNNSASSRGIVRHQKGRQLIFWGEMT